jgi:hypothetical protein
VDRFWPCLHTLELIDIEVIEMSLLLTLQGCIATMAHVELTWLTLKGQQVHLAGVFTTILGYMLKMPLLRYTNIDRISHKTSNRLLIPYQSGTIDEYLDGTLQFLSEGENMLPDLDRAIKSVRSYASGAIQYLYFV